MTVCSPLGKLRPLLLPSGLQSCICHRISVCVCLPGGRLGLPSQSDILPWCCDPVVIEWLYCLAPCVCSDLGTVKTDPFLAPGQGSGFQSGVHREQLYFGFEWLTFSLPLPRVGWEEWASLSRCEVSWPVGVLVAVMPHSERQSWGAGSGQSSS